MKFIIKGNAPAELRHWIEGQPVEGGRRINCRYTHMPGDVKRVVKQCLLNEQGWLCCYTGMLVDEAGSHVEHFKPQSLCQETEDVDYANLLAAYPGDNVRSCPYGAHAKGNWYDEALLVSPLRGDCESRFLFDQFGRISPASEKDLAAVETIGHLHLDDRSLTEMREQAINATLYTKGRERSAAQLQRIATDYCQRDRVGKFRTFCFVVQQAAQTLLHRAERERRRKQAIRQQEQK